MLILNRYLGFGAPLPALDIALIALTLYKCSVSWFSFCSNYLTHCGWLFTAHAFSSDAIPLGVIRTTCTFRSVLFVLWNEQDNKYVFWKGSKVLLV